MLQHLVGLDLVTTISDVRLFDVSSKSPVDLNADLVQTIDELPDDVILWVYDLELGLDTFNDVRAQFPTKTVRNSPSEGVTPSGVNGSWFGIKQSLIILVASTFTCIMLHRLPRIWPGHSADAG